MTGPWASRFARIVLLSGAGVIVLASSADCALRISGASGDSVSQSAAASAPDSLRVYTLPPVVTTTTRAPVLRVPPASRTVLDRAWLRRTDPINLGHALLPVAGIRMVDLGDGAGQSVSLRGFRSDRVAILVDGRPRNTAQGGGVDLSLLDLEALDRVEITRGAQSANAGLYALGGSVNLVRRRDRAPESAFRVLAGTEDRALLQGSTGWASGRATVEGGFRAERAEPHAGTLPGRMTAGSGHLLAAIHPRWAEALETSVELSADTRGVPGSRDFPTPNAEREDRFVETALRANGVSLGHVPGQVSADVAWSTFRREFRDPTHPLGAIDERHTNRRLCATAAWNTAGDHSTFGSRVEAGTDQLESSTDGARSRNRAAWSAEGSLETGAWSVSALARLDWVEGFTGAPGARVGAARTWQDDSPTTWTLRAGAGTGFRPPTFDDLFWPARGSASGNPGLQPERAWDADLALGVTGTEARAQVGVFVSRIDDLIQWVPGSDGVWRPHNVGRAAIHGVEGDLSWGLATGPVLWPLDACSRPAHASVRATPPATPSPGASNWWHVPRPTALRS